MQVYAINTHSMALHVKTGRSMYPLKDWTDYRHACYEWLWDHDLKPPFQPVVELTPEETEAFRAKYMQARV